MFKKRFLSGFIVLTLFASSLYSWPMVSYYMAWAAHHSSGSSTAVAGEPARAQITVEASTVGISAAPQPYYPVQYNKEYFYRASSNEPIRDFRSYKVKTFSPNSQYYKAQNNEPIRDFRYYKNNPVSNYNYSVKSTASNLDHTVKNNRPIRDIRPVWSSD
ncbi:MAG TPA: hypothetical protein VGK25_00505 [Ignavibacteria bacterium]|jgi:hypothetical protein